MARQEPSKPSPDPRIADIVELFDRVSAVRPDGGAKNDSSNRPTRRGA